MNIRTRLVIIATLSFGIVFTVSALVVYSVFYKNSEKIIFNELEYSSLLTAYFYLEEDELSTKEHNKIRSEYLENIQNSKVKIYDGNNEFSYGNTQTGKSKFITNEILKKVRDQGKIQFKKDHTYFYGRHYPDNQGDFVVFVISENEFFASQSNQLIIILISTLFIGLILILLLSWYLSKVAYQPITKIVRHIEEIDVNSMENSHLSVPKTKDEVHTLTLKFNELIHQISETFSIQKNFVNYISHEIKTPLASISGHLEVFGKKDRNPGEYKDVTETVLQNVYEIEDILRNLMTVSGLQNAGMHPEKLRIDELIWVVLDKIYLQYPSSKNQIQVDLKVDNYNLLEVMANKRQLEIAFYNLIENAIKYSDEKPIQILISESENHLQLTIKDQGKGIPAEELNFISQPFQRGSNVEGIKGSGIGLSLAVLIFRQNQIGFQIQSELHKGTEIQLSF